MIQVAGTLTQGVLVSDRIGACLYRPFSRWTVPKIVFVVTCTDSSVTADAQKNLRHVRALIRHQKCIAKYRCNKTDEGRGPYAHQICGIKITKLKIDNIGNVDETPIACSD